MMFGEVDAALSLLDRFTGWFGKRKLQRQESVATRFVRLFESHGVHRNQIPRFFGHELTVADVKDDDTLLARLTEQILGDAADLFAVRREWLDCADQQIYPEYDFYKDPEGFSEFLDKLLADGKERRILGVLFSPIEDTWDAQAVLILEENIGYIGEKPIHRYYLCNGWAFGYWKARAYLTACIASAWNRNVHIRGVQLPEREIAKFVGGKMLLGQEGEGIWALGGKRWYPEDMALEPGAFLKGIAPEKANFGIKSALDLWLDLEARGLMNTGIRPTPRKAFDRFLRGVE